MNLSELVNSPRPLWMRDALCREYPDVTWFPASTVLSDYDAPKAVCNRCLVRSDCLAFALERKIDYGVWGGMTAPDRRHAFPEQLGRPVRRRTRSRSAASRLVAAEAPQPATAAVGRDDASPIFDARRGIVKGGAE